MTTRAFIGLGSNVGDRLEHLRRALAAMEEKGLQVLRTSSIYETAPVGPPQPLFLNAVCAVETSLPPLRLLAVLKEVEAEVGRAPGERWGPREIDLDLLLYGDETVAGPGLTVPHPRLTERAFVLVPLLEIEPDATLPSGQRLSVFAEPVPAGVRRFSPPPERGGPQAR